MVCIQELAADQLFARLILFVVSLAFHGLLRISNLAPRQKCDISLDRHLHLCDICLATDCSGLYITLYWTNTEWNHTPPIVIFVPANNHADCGQMVALVS